jgi:hypothetical protein
MIPKISLENIKLSKMVCGTNQFIGITHRWNPLDMLAHLIRFKEAKTVSIFMIYLQKEHGVNCCVSSPRMKIYNAIKMCEKETGEKFHWLCTPSRRRTVKGLLPNLFTQIDWCAAHDVSVCLPHRDYTDNALDKTNLTLETHKSLPPFSKVSAHIRDKGMIPGLSTHYIESIETVEKQKYDVALIIQPLNKINFESDTTNDKLIQKIQETKLQILNIKPMAAGRLTPQEAIPWCLKNIKKKDFLAVGFGKYEYCVEDAQLVEKTLKES